MDIYRHIYEISEDNEHSVEIISYKDWCKLRHKTASKIRRCYATTDMSDDVYLKLINTYLAQDESGLDLICILCDNYKSSNDLEALEAGIPEPLVELSRVFDHSIPDKKIKSGKSSPTKDTVSTAESRKVHARLKSQLTRGVIDSDKFEQYWSKYCDLAKSDPKEACNYQKGLYAKNYGKSIRRMVKS